MKEVFDNFELLIMSSGGIIKLKNLFLDLAFQGKLSTENLDDEPVDSLLEKIHVIKKELIKEKKIKCNLNSDSVKPKEIPFKIPKTWRWLRVKDVGQVIGGGTPRTAYPEYYSDCGVPWLKPSDLYQLNRKIINRGKQDISLLGLQKSSAKLMPKGTVLFSSRAPIGYVAIAGNDLATNQGFKSCVPFISEMSEYIYYYLKSASKRIEYQASGTTFKEISGKEFSLIPVPVPPLKEQIRIVNKLDYFLSLCDLLEAKKQEITAYEEYLADAIFDKAGRD